MARKIILSAVASLLMLLTFAQAGNAATGTSLLLPQSAAFSVLGHSCGGIQERAYATGFDAVSGYPKGDVYLQTRCGGSGRGGGYHTTTYSAWVGVTWDFTGVLVSDVALSAAPTVDATFSAFDPYGNWIYNQSNSAYLVLAAGFVPAPRVTGVSPSSGPAAGGTRVTITGTGFSGASAVSFGATAAASFAENSNASITAVSPAADANTVDVTVMSAGGASATSAMDQFTFVAVPTVSGVSPNSGDVYGGTSVTITGAHFTGATAVQFGDTAAGFTVDSDASITAVSPPGEAPDKVEIKVTTPGGTSAIGTADQFTYAGAPTITPTPTPMPWPCADFDGDGVVTVSDIIYVVGHYNTSDTLADLNGDGIVTVVDIQIAINEYNVTCVR